jgi:hypothetical protein
VKKTRRSRNSRRAFTRAFFVYLLYRKEDGYATYLRR